MRRERWLMWVCILAAAARPGEVRTADGGIMARFPGGEVTEEEFEAFLDYKLGGIGDQPLTDAERQQILRAYVVLRALVRDHAVDPESVRATQERIRRRAMVAAIRSEPVRNGLVLSDDDVRAYYHLHRDEFRTNELRFFRHIFLNTAELRVDAADPTVLEGERLSPEALAAAIEEKRKLAETVWARLKEGEDFEVAAQQYSDSGGTDHAEERGAQWIAEVRGDGMYVAGRRIMPEMERVLGELEPGEMSGVFETKHGFEIVKLERHVPAGVPPFEEVRERIARELGRDARRDRKGEVEEEILRGLQVEERFEVPDLPGAASDEVVFRVAGKAGESRFTVADYRELVAAVPPPVRERIESSLEERARFLRENVLMEQAAYLVAQEKGLDRDPQINRRVEAELLESIALEGFNRRVEAEVDAMPVEEKDLEEVWALPLSQRFFSSGARVRLEALAVGMMADEEAEPSTQHFGKRYALRLAERIHRALARGEPYQRVVAAYSISATEERPMAHSIAMPGGPEALAVTGKPLGADRVRALGDLGWVTESDLMRMGVASPDAAKAVIRLVTGAVGEGPIEYRTPDGSAWPGPEGYLVVRITEREDARVRPLAEVRDEVEQLLRGRRAQQVRERMYNELLAAVECDLNRPAWDAVWQRREDR